MDMNECHFICGGVLKIIPQRGPNVTTARAPDIITTRAPKMLKADTEDRFFVGTERPITYGHRISSQHGHQG